MGCVLFVERFLMEKKVSVPMKDGSTTGLKSHLKRHHDKEYKKLYPTETTSNKSINLKNQLKMNSFIKKELAVDKNRKIVTWMCHKNLPKNFFDDRETQKFFDWLNPDIPVPRKNQANDMIHDEFIKMQVNIQHLLKNNDSK
ncbi:hypothetical protein TKK_0011892 [Trichogramma kaykai]